MVDLGINLASEAHGPNELLENAVRAEEAGFDFAVISDHYHPWTSRQGHSPFVWSTIGSIAPRTADLEPTSSSGENPTARGSTTAA